MNTNWSLDAIYTGFDDPAFETDWSALLKKIEEMNHFAATHFSDTQSPTKVLEGYVSLQQELAEFSTLHSFLSLTLSTDTSNSKAAKYSDRLATENAKLSAAATMFKQYVGALEDLNDSIKPSPLLSHHAFYLAEVAKESHHTASAAEEQLLAQLRTTGSTAWTNQFNMLTSSTLLDLELEGQPQQITLSAIRNLAYDKDQTVRKTAYLAELGGYKKMEQSLANSLNAIKGETLTVASLRGYDSILEMTLTQSRMDNKTLDAMWQAITEYLPSFRRYFHRKAEMLGHSNGLPFYDLFAPLGETDMELSYAQGADIVVKSFTGFNPEMGAFARHAFDHQWIDVYSKEGKRGGAFCHTVRPLGESRILTNYSNSFDGTLTLGHELGHAYHGKCLGEETALNASCPMPIAETASTFCETLILQDALKTATREESISILESYLLGLTQVIIDIYSRFLFETALIEQRQQGALSVDEIKNLMLDAQRQAYGDGLDPDYLHPYMWACKPHYYSGGLSFYNFPYAYGQLFALGLYAIYQKEGDRFLPQYDAILNATGRNTLQEIGQLAGIDVQDVAFWKSSLQTAEQELERFLELTE